MDGRPGEKTIDPEELLRGALEKIVFFECRVGQLESELDGARQAAERARADASTARRREMDLAHGLEEEKGARGEVEARAGELAERVRLLETERERLLSGLVDRARVGGAPGSGGEPGPEEGGADLAGFIAELRAEIERLRPWKAAAEAAGLRLEGPGEAPHAPHAPEPVARLAERLRESGRVGLTGRDAEHMKDLLHTRSDRVLYERSMEQLGSSDAHERIRGTRSLEALGSRAAAPLLAAALGREPEPEAKAALLGALARFKEPFAAELAERELRDPRPVVRVAALEALAAVAEGAANDRLAGALADPSPLVRRRAALLLGFARGPGAEEALAGALSDRDPGVARAAAAALSGRPSARAQNALARALEHGDASVRRVAAGALGRWTGEAVDADAPAHDRRRAARRIAEKLAAMGGSELRQAVLDAAPQLATAPVTAGSPGRGGRVTSTDRTEAPVVDAPAFAPAPAAISAPTPAARPRLERSSPPSPPATGGERSFPPSPPATGGERSFPPSPPASAGGEGRGEGAAFAPALAPTPAARAAVAILEVEAPQGGGGLDDALVAEVRAALRGCTAEDLAASVGEPLPRVVAVLQALVARGALAQRGPRWFTG